MSRREVSSPNSMTGTDMPSRMFLLQLSQINADYTIPAEQLFTFCLLLKQADHRHVTSAWVEHILQMKLGLIEERAFSTLDEGLKQLTQLGHDSWGIAQQTLLNAMTAVYRSLPEPFLATYDREEIAQQMDAFVAYVLQETLPQNTTLPAEIVEVIESTLHQLLNDYAQWTNENQLADRVVYQHTRALRHRLITQLESFDHTTESKDEEHPDAFILDRFADEMMTHEKFVVDTTIPCIESSVFPKAIQKANFGQSLKHFFEKLFHSHRQPREDRARELFQVDLLKAEDRPFIVQLCNNIFEKENATLMWIALPHLTAEEIIDLCTPLNNSRWAYWVYAAALYMSYRDEDSNKTNQLRTHINSLPRDEQNILLPDALLHQLELMSHHPFSTFADHSSRMDMTHQPNYSEAALNCLAEQYPLYHAHIDEHAQELLPTDGDDENISMHSQKLSQWIGYHDDPNKGEAQQKQFIPIDLEDDDRRGNRETTHHQDPDVLFQQLATYVPFIIKLCFNIVRLEQTAVSKAQTLLSSGLAHRFDISLLLNNGLRSLIQNNQIQDETTLSSIKKSRGGVYSYIAATLESKLHQQKSNGYTEGALFDEASTIIQDDQHRDSVSRLFSCFKRTETQKTLTQALRNIQQAQRPSCFSVFNQQSTTHYHTTNPLLA